MKVKSNAQYVSLRGDQIIQVVKVNVPEGLDHCLVATVEDGVVRKAATSRVMKVDSIRRRYMPV